MARSISYLEKWPITRGWTAGRAVLDGKPVHLPDTQSDEAEDFPDSAGAISRSIHRLQCSHRAVGAAVAREQAIGAILLRRIEMRPFSDKQIDCCRRSPTRR